MTSATATRLLPAFLRGVLRGEFPVFCAALPAEAASESGRALLATGLTGKSGQASSAGRGGEGRPALPTPVELPADFLSHPRLAEGARGPASPEPAAKAPAFPALFRFQETTYLADADWDRFAALSGSAAAPSGAITGAVGETAALRETGTVPAPSEGRAQGLRGRAHNRICVVTGGAQGFGAGIAESLAREGAVVVIADLNEEKGAELARSLGRAFFHRLDVTRPESWEALADFLLARFGGFDALVSNAGILKAGPVEELSLENFRLVTEVNYTAYFLGVKTLAPLLKAQGRAGKGFTDIIQINSKSGLEGSNKNSAYAGGKFGGIGLTQSFALELVGDRIKVNAVCPGNFFEGPLWSDPEKGLFVQYLRAGKVPGAKTVDDVKRFYEDKVPMRRGCRVEDVMRAILYLLEQEYETGQAVPVTGGQVMLN